MRTNDAGEQGRSYERMCSYVKKLPGDEVEEDYSCDPSFMLDNIPRIGKRLVASINCVPANEKNLFVDNAGGHGTDASIQQYPAILLYRFNVQIIWQVPSRSPETKELDLVGIWMSIQVAVAKSRHLDEQPSCGSMGPSHASLPSRSTGKERSGCLEWLSFASGNQNACAS